MSHIFGEECGFSCAAVCCPPVNAIGGSAGINVLLGHGFHRRYYCCFHHQWWSRIKRCLECRYRISSTIIVTVMFINNPISVIDFWIVVVLAVLWMHTFEFSLPVQCVWVVVVEVITRLLLILSVERLVMVLVVVVVTQGIVDWQDMILLKLLVYLNLVKSR